MFKNARFVLAVLICLFALGLASPASAQTGTPASQFVVDQAAPDLATSSSLVFKRYDDGATTGIATTFTCTGTASPFVCKAPFPAYTPGPHSVTFSASNAAGESPKSVPLTFTFVVIPATPANPRIQ